MKKKILSYQTNAISTCINHLQDHDEFKLQSPTGSGKTFIISQIIDKYLENIVLNNKPTTFIFIAPSTGGLDYQGYDKISHYITNDWAKGYTTEYIGTTDNKINKSYLTNIDCFKPNTCYFFGWQMFKKGTKITEIDSEKNDIYKVISNTKMKNINIVLIIDEAHREISINENGKGEGDKNTKDTILDFLSPYKTIKVSATLEHVNNNVDYKITYDDVRDEAAIKQNVIISSFNDKVDNLEQYNENQQLVISALKKQEEIKKEYYKKNIDIKPLILIQIPDKVMIEEINSEEVLLKDLESFLDKLGYKKGVNYAIWLDKIKTNTKEEVTDNNSSIELLIFKTAIATGWDIPRANILVRIREAKTKAFNIQTLGRILRNPFFKYYNNELIDNSFVYTMDENYKNYIKNESIAVDVKNIINAKRSQKALTSKFKLNKVLIDKKYDNDKLIEYVVDQVIKNPNFKKKYFEYRDNKISPASISTREIVEHNKNNIQDGIHKQIKLNLNPSKETLFNIFIKYKTIIKSNLLEENILDSIAAKLSILNIKIKDFYKATIHNYDKKPCFNIDGNHLTLKEYIKYQIKQFQARKENIEQKIEVFTLPEEYKVNKNQFSNIWDKCSTYEYSIQLESLESSNEKEFYKTFKSKLEELDKNIHIFRNGTNNNIDYYIEYISNDGEIKKFFPDFIVINDLTKKAYIFEAKGRNNQTDIDINSKIKFKRVKELIDGGIIDADLDYCCNNIYRVSYDKETMHLFENDDHSKEISDVYQKIVDYYNER